MSPKRTKREEDMMSTDLSASLGGSAYGPLFSVISLLKAVPEDIQPVLGKETLAQLLTEVFPAPRPRSVAQEDEVRDICPPSDLLTRDLDTPPGSPVPLHKLLVDPAGNYADSAPTSACVSPVASLRKDFGSSLRSARAISPASCASGNELVSVACDKVWRK